jgi:methyl-accepting chemotaxis protein
LVEETNAAIEQTEAQAAELDRIVAIFHVEGKEAAVPRIAPAAPASLKVKAAARTYLSDGNTALDWAEF